MTPQTYQPDRNTPRDLEAEKAVLGAMLMGGSDLLEDYTPLRADDFYLHKHRWIWEAIGHLTAADQAVDVITVSSELEQAGHFAEVGGTAYLVELIGAVGSMVHAASYAETVRHEATRRRAIEVLTETAKDIYKANGNLPVILEQGAARLDALSPATTPGMSLGDAALEWVTGIRDWLDTGDIPGLATGYGRLDRNTHGLKRGEVAVLAGRPSMGKSSLAFQIAERQALAGLCVGIFSLEMPRRDVSERIGLARLGLDKFKLTRLDLARLQGEFDRQSAMPIRICDDAGLSIGEIGREARTMSKYLGGLDMIVVDHLDYIRHEGERGDSKTARIGASMKGLVRLAKGMNAAVLLLCQLNRAVTQRANHEPDLEDLRESGDIEQDARQVWFIHRPAYYADIDSQPPKDLPQKALVIVRKNHTGPRNISVPLAFVENCARFAEWSPI
jgi:replicative DNA helicase